MIEAAKGTSEVEYSSKRDISSECQRLDGRLHGWDRKRLRSELRCVAESQHGLWS